MRRWTLAKVLRAPRGFVGRPAILGLLLTMSLPAIMAQLSDTMMSYIDAAMVGSLGAEASASVGLVEATIWLSGGLIVATGVGFSIQAAQKIGARDHRAARAIFHQALLAGGVFSVLLFAIMALISRPLPHWLGASADIASLASGYFLAYMLSLPFFQLRYIGAAMLQATGNMRTPGLLSVFVCLLDVFWNYLFIYPTHSVELASTALTIPGAGLGVIGAGLGTTVAEICGSLLMLHIVLRHSEILHTRPDDSWRLTRPVVSRAIRLAVPVGLQGAVLTGALIAITVIIAPLGAASIAANSFATTVEGFCYMAGFGLSIAVSPIVGQCLGARRPDLIRTFAHCAVGSGMIVMGILAIALYLLAPHIMTILTPDAEVRRLATAALRVELYAEPLFAAAIISSGALNGLGDTAGPSLISAICVWGLRLPLSLLVVSSYGVVGIWAVMCGELSVRGIIMYGRLTHRTRHL